MPDFIDIRRVTVIVATDLEEQVLQEFTKLGAKGYTCVYCTGKGRHAVYDNPMQESPLVKIQVMARPRVAEAIMRYMHTAGFRGYPALAVMDTVTVFADDNFF